jgi:hypothetical protein
MKIQTRAKAELIATVLGRLTGRRPAIEFSGETARVAWVAEDLPVVREWFENQLSPSAVPSDVTVDLLPVISPFVTRKVLPAALGAVLGGFILGKL